MPPSLPAKAAPVPRRPRDPADSTGLRWWYRDWRPTPWGRMGIRVWRWATALGLLPPCLLTLEVADRRSGKPGSTVLAVVEYEGARYIVSMLGDTSEWVKNLRAAGGEAIVRRGRAWPARAVEIAEAERAPILKAWCQIATSGRRHLPVAPDATLTDFQAIARDYPVFRIDPRP